MGIGPRNNAGARRVFVASISLARIKHENVSENIDDAITVVSDGRVSSRQQL
jgi:hypothetical protein